MNKIREVFVHPLIFMVLLVSILYVILHALAIPDSGGTFDIVLFYAVAGISAIAALFILVRTKWRDWTALGAGLLGHFLAVGLIYFISVYYQSHMPNEYTHLLVMLARSTLIVSGSFVLYGIVMEWLSDLGCDSACVWQRVTHPLQTVKGWFKKD